MIWLMYKHVASVFDFKTVMFSGSLTFLIVKEAQPMASNINTDGSPGEIQFYHPEY